MKNGFIVLLVLLSVQINCKSQDYNLESKKVKTKQRFLLGYSKQFTQVDLGVTFIKDLIQNDTIYFVKFKLTTPTSDDRCEIFIGKNNTILFVTKSGKTVILPFNENVLMEEVVVNKDSPLIPHRFYYTSTFYLKITKEQLLTIGAEPFGNITLTYNDYQSNKVCIAIFYTPNFYVSKSFTIDDIDYLLNSKFR